MARNPPAGTQRGERHQSPPQEQMTATQPRRRTSALAIAWLSVAAIFAGMIGWAAVTYEPGESGGKVLDSSQARGPATTASIPATGLVLPEQMPKTPKEIAARDREPLPLSVSAGIAPDISDDENQEREVASTSESGSGLAPDIAEDENATESGERAGTAPDVGEDVEVSEIAESAPASMGPTITGADDNESAGKEADNQGALEQKVAAIEPEISALDGDENTPVPGAGIKTDIGDVNTSAGFQPSRGAISPDVASDEVSVEEAGVEDEATETAVIDTMDTDTRVLPTVTPTAGSTNIVMAPVPDPAIVHETPKGPLPVISDDGRRAWKVYARPFRDDPDKTLIAILLGGMGMSQSATNSAIQQLPGEVTLSFAAYARGLRQWISGARAAGHEVMLQLPMEPMSYPANDPGPHTLLTSLSSAENIDRMEWILSRFVGYVGVTSFMGSKFTTSPQHLRPIMIELKERGLLFLDSGATLDSVAAQIGLDIGLPIAVSDRFFDRRASRVAIDAQLLELEQVARGSGIAIGIGYPFPVTIERLATWLPTLEQKGIELAPISAIVGRIQRSGRAVTTTATPTPG